MKKLTKEKLYEIMDNFVAADSIYRELLPYLADEQQAEQRTKPEPSRLEVAAILANGLGYILDQALEWWDDLPMDKKEGISLQHEYLGYKEIYMAYKQYLKLTRHQSDTETGI